MTNFNILFNLAHRFNLNIVLDERVRESYFQNKTIYVPNNITELFSTASKNYVASSIAHELSHFIIAPPSRKYKKDYGIPSRKYQRNPFYWNLDEYKASVIENELMKACGFHHYKNPLSNTGTADKSLKLRPFVLEWWRANKTIVSDLKIK